MQRKRLPVGIQTFKDIRNLEENWIYVDKTESAYKIIKAAKYNFLSRPRRFGKSLFIDTLSELFKGSKDLFKDLFIYDKWNWEKQFPVIKIDFTSGDFSSANRIDEVIKSIISDNCDDLQLTFSQIYNNQNSITLKNLIKQTYLKYNQKAIVLIDEYDKPILDNIGKKDKTAARQARDILKNFYSSIKQSDAYLQFVFITGVSKFSKLNLFSGLNNLEDITIDNEYATIAGYTQNELEQSFKEYLKDVDIEAVKRWYNGYNYLGEPVYNPFDILLFFSKNGEFRNYWWETGNPSFLIEKLKESNYFLPELENIEVGKETLDAFDVENIELPALLWQTGYLTFDKKLQVLDDISYKMKVPNLEIQKSLNALFFDYLTNLEKVSASRKRTITGLLLDKDFDAFKQELVSLFAAIPYENYVNNTIANYEGYYASVLFAFLSSLSFLAKTEESTNSGRIDMTLIGPENIFILEFKVDMSAEAALHQIEKKKYYEKYLNKGKEIHFIGIHFSSKERNIVEMEWQKKPCI